MADTLGILYTMLLVFWSGWGLGFIMACYTIGRKRSNDRAERDKALEKWRIGEAMVDRADADLAAARDEICRLGTALLFYAEKRNWRGDKIANDGGNFARAFLERTATSAPTPEEAKVAP